MTKEGIGPLWLRRSYNAVGTPRKAKAMGTIPMISIVDDDALVREGIGDLVKSLGYGALMFASAEEFLGSGQVKDTACLITDLQMPGLKGLDLQSHLLDAHYDTPVIFVTAFPTNKARTKALKAGAVAFLSKPFEESSLIGSIEIALDIDRRRRHQNSGSEPRH
jgi:FixJ family two-component response regulator